MATTTQQIQLAESGSVTLDASGNGTVTIGPYRANQVWKVSIISVMTSTATLSPQARVYLGSRATYLGGTYTGDNDSSEYAQPVILRRGQQIIVDWTGGDVGATATVNLYGLAEVA